MTEPTRHSTPPIELPLRMELEPTPVDGCAGCTEPAKVRDWARQSGDYTTISDSTSSCPGTQRATSDHGAGAAPNATRPGRPHHVLRVLHRMAGDLVSRLLRLLRLPDVHALLQSPVPRVLRRDKGAHPMVRTP